MALFDLSNPYDAESFKRRAKQLLDKRAKVELKAKHPARSKEQNAYLHILLRYFAIHFGEMFESVKCDLFEDQLNADIFRPVYTNKNGEKRKGRRSTTELDTAEMTLAIRRFREYSAGVAELYLPEPNEGNYLFYIEKLIESNKEYSFNSADDV